MPLDLDHTHPMYLLGRAAAVIEGPFPNPRKRSRLADGPELDVLLTYPAKGFGLLRRRFAARLVEHYVQDFLQILPSTLPKGPIPIEQQSEYWLGYYHQRGQDKRDIWMTNRFTADRVRQLGELLFGLDDWQSEMARALGINDVSRVHAWVEKNPAKRRRVPAGICRDLLEMLHQSAEAGDLADELTDEINREAKNENENDDEAEQ